MNWKSFRFWEFLFVIWCVFGFGGFCWFGLAFFLWGQRYVLHSFSFFVTFTAILDYCVMCCVHFQCSSDKKKKKKKSWWKFLSNLIYIGMEIRFSSWVLGRLPLLFSLLSRFCATAIQLLNFPKRKKSRASSSHRICLQLGTTDFQWQRWTSLVYLE